MKKNLIFDHRLLKKISLLSGIFFLFVLVNLAAADSAAFGNTNKEVTIDDDGLTFQANSGAQTVGDLLSEQKITLGAHDLVFPGKDEKIYSSTNVIIQRAKSITIVDGDNKINTYTFQKVVESAVWEQKNIDLEDDDFTTPDRKSLLKDGMTIKVTHVEIKEEEKDKPIPYDTTTNEDDTLSWRIKKVTQKGQNGILQVNYRVVYYNGKEISRKVLNQQKTKDPVDEVVTQGTFVKVGKTYTGVGSWYSYTGTLAAANPWLPMGSYVRVTNQDNGKQVIVKINDRGPFGNGRIIDLDKAAFTQIANLGQGTANVKVEAITN